MGGHRVFRWEGKAKLLNTTVVDDVSSKFARQHPEKAETALPSFMSDWEEPQNGNRRLSKFLCLLQLGSSAFVH
jgi:hypothetical protein